MTKQELIQAAREIMEICKEQQENNANCLPCRSRRNIPAVERAPSGFEQYPSTPSLTSLHFCISGQRTASRVSGSAV